MPDSTAYRRSRIRKLSTSELKTYDAAYRKGQVYKFARDEAKAELKRRAKKGRPRKMKMPMRKRRKSGYDLFTF